jgi:hypothetical protein
LLAEKEISEDEYEKWSEHYKNASIEISKRDEKIELVAD